MSIDSSLLASDTPEFKIDLELKDLIPPLTDSEYAALKEMISKDGCREPLTIWKDQNIILDGHNRYQICTELHIPFKKVEIELPDHTAAKVWMIKNQRGRRNIDESQRAMLAVKLEALYAEQAKERKGSRTDLGQTLGPGEYGRSAEKAAKDMDVSHQTVTYAKTVSTKGIPDLIKLVESGYASVSAAAKVTSLPAKSQAKLVKKAEIQIKEGTRPNVAALIREIAPRLPEDDPDVLLETSRKNQETSLKLLEGIEKTQRPENLVEMRAMSEKILARLNEIEMNNLDPEIKSQASSVIGLKHFKTFIESVSQISETVNLKFDSDGIRAKASNPSANMMVEAFLPKSLFSRYVELGEIGLPNTKKLIGMLAVLSSGRISGKANLRIYVKQGTDSNPIQLHMISGQTDMDYLLQDPMLIEDQKFPEPISTCKVHIEGKKLAEAIKQSTNLSKTATSRISESAKFFVSKKFFRIVTEDENHDKVTAKPKCEVLEDGSADSTFDIDELMTIYPIIGKSKDITLSLGMNQPMILDMTIDKMTIMYQIKEKELKKDSKEEQGAN